MKLFGMKSPAQPPCYQDVSYRKIAEDLPSLPGDMGWLLEYAKFRAAWLTDRMQWLDDRSVAVLKAIGAIVGAAWAAVLWAGPATASLPPALSLACIAASGTGLLVGAVAAAMVLLPTTQDIPRDEHAAFACALDNPQGADPKGRFAAFLAETTQHRIAVAHRKGRRLQVAFAATAAAVVILLVFLGLAAAGAAYRQGKPSLRAAAHLPPSRSAAPAALAGPARPEF